MKPGFHVTVGCQVSPVLLTFKSKTMFPSSNSARFHCTNLEIFTLFFGQLTVAYKANFTSAKNWHFITYLLQAPLILDKLSHQNGCWPDSVRGTEMIGSVNVPFFCSRRTIVPIKHLHAQNVQIDLEGQKCKIFILLEIDFVPWQYYSDLIL